MARRLGRLIEARPGEFGSQFAERFERGSEAAANSDLRKLVVVADEDDLGAS